jgi:tetratricopeptide (TPR) repeat protein
MTSFSAQPVLVIAFLFPLAFAQTQDTAILMGSVHDSSGPPIAASVSLIDAHGQVSIAHADVEGKYRFSALRPGTYTLRAEMTGFTAATSGPFVLANGTRHIDLTLASAPAAQFYDEPNFVIAGVTDTNAHGGHGSDTVVRSTESLAKAAAALSKERGGSGKLVVPVTVESLRAEIAREPTNAALHHSLGNLEEKNGNALDAAREYQRAAELNPTENNLFDWGTELLMHRAAEQAIEVFAKGNRLFPQSSRMLLGLGAALYARGSYDEASRRFFEATDLNPADSGPYLFLGKVLQGPEVARLDGFVERLRRFASLQPENALANYYSASAIWRSWRGPEDLETAAQTRSFLMKAVRLDPTLADAWYQLGIVYSSLSDFPDAITAYQKAIETRTQHEEAHYRLGQAYQQIGESVKARSEFALYDRLRKTAAAEEERERSQIQQFVFTLRQ